MNERLRKAYALQVKPFLQADEELTHVFLAARGENPWVGAWSTVVRFPRQVVVTNRAVLLLSCKTLGRPDAVVARLPRETKLGPPESTIWTLLLTPLWGRQAIRVNGERLWAMTSAKELREIDAAGA